MPSPILALLNNIVAAFENPNGSAVGMLRTCIADGGISQELELCHDESSPVGPKVIKVADEPACIQLHVAHLELLWSFVYGWVVLYEEAVQRPSLDGRFDGRVLLDSELTARAAELLEWASSLRTNYSRWPAGLPMPRPTRAGVERDYCLKVNGIFQSAVAFLLFHELAHVVQRHIGIVDRNDVGPAALATAIEMERDADDFAYRMLVPADADEPERMLKGWAVLAPALSSLYLIDGRVGLFQRRHPHLHHRIQDLLAKLNFQDGANRDYYHYLCATILGVISRAHDQDASDRLAPQVFENVDAAFAAEMDELDEFLNAVAG